MINLFERIFNTVPQSNRATLRIEIINNSSVLPCGLSAFVLKRKIIFSKANPASE